MVLQSSRNSDHWVRCPPFQEQVLYSNPQYVSQSGLVALLRDWTFEDKDAGSADTAERLSHWLNPLDTIALHAAHRSIHATGKALPPPVGKKLTIELDVEFRRIHSELSTSLVLPDPSIPKYNHAKHVEPQVESIVNPDTPYTPYRQHHFEQQRLMERQIDSFRRRCRLVLSQSRQHHRQLAELDVTMEQLFGERERALLSKLPALLERRFQALKAMQPNANNPAPPAVPLGQAGSQSEPNSWITTFGNNFQEALRAELIHRLNPVAGMVEAFSTEI